MTRRARTVSMTITVETEALYYVDHYAQEHHFSRSGAVNELLRLARAYLKVLDAQDGAEAGDVVEKPGFIIKREARSRVGSPEYLEELAAEVAARQEKKPKKKPKK